ncbi:hypothetical protein D3C73_1413020 [compost metagenome]
MRGETLLMEQPEHAVHGLPVVILVSLFQLHDQLACENRTHIEYIQRFIFDTRIHNDSGVLGIFVPGCFISLRIRAVNLVQCVNGITRIEAQPRIQPLRKGSTKPLQMKRKTTASACDPVRT